MVESRPLETVTTFSLLEADEMSSVPVLYRSAAEVLKKSDKRQGSLKSLVFSCQSDSHRKKIYALVSNTIKRESWFSDHWHGNSRATARPSVPM